MLLGANLQPPSQPPAIPHGAQGLTSCIASIWIMTPNGSLWWLEPAPPLSIEARSATESVSALQLGAIIYTPWLPPSSLRRGNYPVHCVPWLQTSSEAPSSGLLSTAVQVIYLRLAASPSLGPMSLLSQDCLHTALLAPRSLSLWKPPGH